MAMEMVFLKLEWTLENTYLKMRKVRLRKVKWITWGHSFS